MKKNISHLRIRFTTLCEQYYEKFDDFFPTEVGGSFEELIDLLERCLKEGKTYAELTGDYYEEGMDY